MLYKLMVYLYELIANLAVNLTIKPTVVLTVNPRVNPRIKRRVNPRFNHTVDRLSISSVSQSVDQIINVTKVVALKFNYRIYMNATSIFPNKIKLTYIFRTVTVYAQVWSNLANCSNRFQD